MANITSRWHGDNYQSRRFWIHAAALLDDLRPDVVEVSFEADGPKAFDDIIVKYNPGRRNTSGPDRIVAEYFQIKWHTDDSGHFGYADLIDPEFLRATAVSLLQRLRNAKADCEPNSAFHFVTTYSLKEADPLTELVSGKDGSLRLDKLFDKTTDRSRMGQVRKLWREHLELKSDAELRVVLEGFHIEKGAKSLDALREDVALHFRLVSLQGRDAESTFIYDEAARTLVSKNINRLDRAAFRKLCEEEGWFIPLSVRAKRGVAINSYEPRALPADIALAAPEHTLVLQDHFEGRLLRAERSWSDVRDQVRAFLSLELAQGPEIRLFLEAPASIAFLAGTSLNLKSGAAVELVQIGYGNSRQIWDTHDQRPGPDPIMTELWRSEGDDIALVLSLARNALPKVEQYVARALPSVGKILHMTPAEGAGLSAIRGGEHALRIASLAAEAVSNTIAVKGRVHVFLSAPNAFSFYLGQQTQMLGSCVLYEFDLMRETDGSYYPSFET
jgi:hypothetical protein